MNNNNNNNQFKVLYIIILFYFNFSNKILNKLITFKSDPKENFLQNFESICKNHNINISLSIKNFNKNIYGDFNAIPLKNLLKICFQDYDINIFNNFIIIQDPKMIKKIYYISSSFNENQLENINIFLKELIKDGNFILNKEDGTIFVNTFKEVHELVEIYINKINLKANQQILFECKIIALKNNKLDNYNLNLPKITQNLLKNNFFSLFINTNYNSIIYLLIKNLFFFSELDEVCKFLSKKYIVNNICDIKLLLLNKQLYKFKTEELRYTSNYYDTTLIEDSNLIKDENIRNNKINNKKLSNSPYLIKNLKSFTSGINLSIKPIINDQDVNLLIDFTKSNFNENKKYEDLPYIVTNNFNCLTKIKFDQIVILNGLKNTIKTKIIKNKTPFKILNFFLSSEEIIEEELEIIFLIKIKKII